jgi:hypothetical protein
MMNTSCNAIALFSILPTEPKSESQRFSRFHAVKHVSCHATMLRGQMSLIASRHQSRITVKINLTIFLGVSWRQTACAWMLPSPCDWIIISRGTNCVPSASHQVKSLARRQLARNTRICFVLASTKPKAVDASDFIAKDGHDLRRRCSRCYPVGKMENHRRLEPRHSSRRIIARGQSSSTPHQVCKMSPPNF